MFIYVMSRIELKSSIWRLLHCVTTLYNVSIKILCQLILKRIDTMDAISESGTADLYGTHVSWSEIVTFSMRVFTTLFFYKCISKDLFFVIGLRLSLLYSIFYFLLCIILHAFIAVKHCWPLCVYVSHECSQTGTVYVMPDD